MAFITGRACCPQQADRVRHSFSRFDKLKALSQSMDDGGKPTGGDKCEALSAEGSRPHLIIEFK